MSDRVQKLLGQMTLEEKVGLVAGVDMWHSGSVERLGVPGLKVTDGPNGARGDTFHDGTPAVCFPCGSALGATWNPALVERVGIALGEEVKTKGAQVLLAPTVNIHRSPQAGRNFECYSEDPQLSARLGVAFIRGVQSQGIGTTVKHFVCNDSEFERHTISSEVDERALREIYLVPFEAAVREAGTWGLMSAYNRLNGTYCSENEHLLQGILREEWGFDGFVISDWFGTYSTGQALAAGLDLEMPGAPRHRGEKLVEALGKGEVEEAQLDACAGRMLRALERLGNLDTPPVEEESAVDRPEHRELVRQAAAEAIVLLKNDAAALPLDRGALRRLAVVGPSADVLAIHGGGSAAVNPHYKVSPLQGIRAIAGQGVEVVYERGCINHKTLPVLDAHVLTRPGGERGQLAIEFFDNRSLEGEPAHRSRSYRADFTWMTPIRDRIDHRSFSARLTGEFHSAEAGRYSFSLVSAGRSRLFLDDALVVDNWEPEGKGDAFFGAASAERVADIELDADRSYALRIEYATAEEATISGLLCGYAFPVPDDMLERAAAAAAAADAAVVVVGLNADWESEGHDRPDLSLPGRQVELVSAVAAANPRTVVVINAGAPVDMDWIDEVPAALQLWYPGQEGGNALAEVLFGDRDASGRLPTTLPRRLEDTPSFLHYPGEGGRVVYDEGIFVGYRYYDARNIEPRYPFGHGLSYTRFEYGRLELDREVVAPGEPLAFRVEVANAGERRGQEVVQAYVSDLDASVVRPPKELAVFAKIELDPGERRVVALEIPPRALSFYDPAARDWRAEPGEFELIVGSSSRDIRGQSRFRLVDPDA